MAQETSGAATPTSNTPSKKSRSGVWIVGGVAAIVAAIVFAGGVLAANRLSAPSRGEDFGRFGGQRPQVQIESAKELPSATPNLRGIVTKRDGATLSVGQRGGPEAGSNGSASLIDVVVTSGTTVYHDTTQMNFDGQPPSGPIQQTVEPGKLDRIDVNNRVTVWGEQNGNQLTAKVLVYSDPFALQPPQ